MMLDFKQLFERYNVKCTGLLHCGGSFAQERYVYEDLKIPEVLWIEAIPFVFEAMRANLIPFDNQIAIKACLSDVDDEEVTFNISNNEAQSSSFLELAHHIIIHPEVHYIDQIKLNTIRLDTLLNLLERDNKHINFLNGDLQGAELKMLQGLGNLINQFDYIYLEINKRETYKDCALVWDLQEFLSDFTLVEVGEWVSDTWTDGFWIRKTLL